MLSFLDVLTLIGLSILVFVGIELSIVVVSGLINECKGGKS